MSTNLSVYVPNVGEIEALKAILLTEALVVGLFKTAIIPDGNTVFSTLTEMPSGSSRAYAQKELTNVVVEDALAADKWYVSTNGLGKAEGAYSNTPLEWVLNSYDVADANTVYGVFAYTWVLPFDAGSKEIKVGDTVEGGTSTATGIVTGVCLQSGSWAAGTAAGYLNIKTKTGVFQNNEAIVLTGRIVDVGVGANGGANYADGDILSITQANASGGVAIVTANNTGAITGVGLLEGGAGYSTANGLATAKVTGSGANFTANIAAAATVTAAQTNTGTNADAFKKLCAVWPYATGIAITMSGQTITFDLKVALATGS